MHIDGIRVKSKLMLLSFAIEISSTRTNTTLNMKRLSGKIFRNLFSMMDSVQELII